MRLLLDTNVIIDFFLKRNQYKEAEDILSLTIDNQTIECVTSTTITDISFLLKRHSNPKMNSFEIQNKIKELLKILDILPVSKSEIEYALNLQWEDMEDALQYTVAKKNLCSCIITNNIKDFKNSDIKVYTPRDFLSEYEKNNIEYINIDYE